MLPDLVHCIFISLDARWVVCNLSLLHSFCIPAEKTTFQNKTCPQDPMCGKKKKKSKFSLIKNLFMRQREGSAGQGACHASLRTWGEFPDPTEKTEAILEGHVLTSTCSHNIHTNNINYIRTKIQRMFSVKSVFLQPLKLWLYLLSLYKFCALLGAWKSISRNHRCEQSTSCRYSLHTGRPFHLLCV